ncbi:MAG: phosphotransferase [Proteobacteria bacterium]|nr:phosphotransferase [Pseudomonadota bacterium]
MSRNNQGTEKRESSIEIASRPQFSAADVRSVLQEQYDLDGELRALVSERDQNFRVKNNDGRCYVFKIANAAEPEDVTDFQIQTLLHIENAGCPVATPRIIRTVAGAVATKIGDGSGECVCRIVSYVPGIPFSTVEPNARLAADLGASAAALDNSLLGFEHDADQHLLLWHMQRATELRDLLANIANIDLRNMVGTCLDDFERNVLPMHSSLRSQVIHGDLNPDNVLVAQTCPDSIAGVIDFGDIVHGPMIFEVAIAASYLRVKEDPPALIAPFVAGFDKVTTLEAVELELLFDLVRTRLAASITIEHWRRAIRGENDPYVQAYLQSERSVEHFLACLDSMTRRPFTDSILQACRR